MTTPKPSSRVARAAALAAGIGGATFLIWWTTSGRPPETIRQAQPAPPSPSEAASPAPAAAAPAIEMPVGGSVRGTVDSEKLRAAVMMLLDAPLVRVNPSTDQVEPWLAESWAMTPDDKQIALALRANVLWSDGTPLTADQVVASLAAHAAAFDLFGKRVAIDKTDARHIRVSFPSPFPSALRLLATWPIVPQDGRLVVLGPFDGSRKNLHYWRTGSDGKSLPHLESIGLAAADDSVKLLTEGQVDFIDAELSPSDYSALKRLDESNKVRLYDMGAGLSVDSLWLNPHNPLFAKDELRLAISAAIDRRAYCEKVYAGACDPAYGPISPGNATWFLTDMDSPSPDLTFARSTLAGLGLQDTNGDGILEDSGRPVRITALVDEKLPAEKNGAAYLRDALAKIGITLSVTTLTAEAIDARRAKGNYEAIFSRFEPTDTDPALDLSFWVVPNATADWQQKINALMAKQVAAHDKVDRLQLFADVQRIYVQHMPVITLAAPYIYVAASPRLINVKPSRHRPSMLWNADQLALSAR